MNAVTKETGISIGVAIVVIVAAVSAGGVWYGTSQNTQAISELRSAVSSIQKSLGRIEGALIRE